MEPIPATRQALDELDPVLGAPDQLARLAARAQEIAVLDAVQYAAGGPCVEGAHTAPLQELDNDDILDEGEVLRDGDRAGSRASRPVGGCASAHWTCGKRRSPCRPS